MRDKKKWGALVLAVIMAAALSLSGCRQQREKIQVGESETNTLVSTESESQSESESETASETSTEKTTETHTSSETSNNTKTPETPANNGGSSNTGNGGTAAPVAPEAPAANGGTAGGNTAGGNTADGGQTPSADNGTTTGGDTTGSDNGSSENTASTEAPRYFFSGSGDRVDVSQMPDGSWQDANGISYTFQENGVTDSNGNQYYYDPPSNGNTSVEVGTIADFYDDKGNHITCTMDENGNWVDSDGNVYTFGAEGVTDANGNFYPY